MEDIPKKWDASTLSSGGAEEWREQGNSTTFMALVAQ